MTTLTALPLLTSDDWGHHWWWPIWPIFWVAVIGGLVWLYAKRRQRPHDPLDKAREVLAELYARGELTSEEYRARLDGLHVEPR